MIRLAATALIFAVLAGVPRPAAAQWANRQLVFGPLMLALNVAYKEWIAGPLGGRAPSAAAFTATLDGTHDPYTIAFAATKGTAVPTAHYAVSASEVIDAGWPKPSFFLDASKGPLTLSGSYVLAYLSAHAEHPKLIPAYGDAYAFENSIGSSVVIATFAYHGAESLIVGFSQTVTPAGSLRKIGCYKEQYYVVDPLSFVAEKTNIGCPH